MPEPIATTLFIDPACPWGYSATPALRVLRWRYGTQLDWRLVMIGLTETTDQYAKRGFTAVRMAKGLPSFRRYGMPFAAEPKERLSATARGCRAVVAARLTTPGSEWKALRALQLANFTTPLLLDDDESISAVVAAATSIPAATILGLLDDPNVSEAYERDRAEARTATGSPAELQGTTATTDQGIVRYTAPSVIFERGSTTLVAGGMQPIEAYDILIANIDPTLQRRAPADHAAELFEAFPEGLTTGEVAVLLARSNQLPDIAAAELQLIDLAAEGRVTRIGLGDGALWTSPDLAAEWHAIVAAASSTAEPQTVAA
jgi:protein-disulfide isomerase-like protein with CxxC motif